MFNILNDVIFFFDYKKFRKNFACSELSDDSTNVNTNESLYGSIISLNFYKN